MSDSNALSIYINRPGVVEPFIGISRLECYSDISLVVEFVFEVFSDIRNIAEVIETISNLRLL